MPKFVRRTILGNIPDSPYYNEREFVGSGGYYKGRESEFECVNGGMARGCELAEEPLTWFKASDDKPKTECRNPMFKRVGYGNAIEWWNETNYDKTTNHNEARLGDWILYGKGWGWNDEYQAYLGHVRIIEAIEDDFFICSGANETGGYRFDIKVPRENGSGDELNGLIGYIHNPYLSEEEETDFDKIINDLNKSLTKVKTELGTLKEEVKKKDSIIKADKEAFKEVVDICNEKL